MALRRIGKEFNSLTDEERVPLIAVIPEENDLFRWQVTISGPSNSPYQEGVFRISVDFPKDYPFTKPKVKFLTKIYHLNINFAGNICNCYFNEWSPGTTISDILQLICKLLSTPETPHALNTDALKVYMTDRVTYNELAKEWTGKYAK